MAKRTKARIKRDQLKRHNAYQSKARKRNTKELSTARIRINHLGVTEGGNVTIYNPKTHKRITVSIEQFNKIQKTINMSDVEQVGLGYSQSKIVGQYRRQSNSIATKKLKKFQHSKGIYTVKSSELDSF